MALIEIYFNNIRFITGSFNEFTDYIFYKHSSDPTNKLIIVHINLNNYYFLNKDSRFKEEINKCCLLVFEGIGLKIGFWLKGFGLLPDLNGTDLFPLVMKKISGTKLGVFLLGAEETVIKKAVKNISINYPNVNIHDFHHGYFLPDDELEVVEKINRSKSDILIIGRGFPLQEQFALKYKDVLQVSLIWNVGGLFDIISGYKPRAPLILRRMRLEWLFRFLLEPSRMMHRNIVCAASSLRSIIFTKRT